MDLQEAVDQLKSVQYNILQFIDNDENIEENFQNLKNQFDDLHFEDNGNTLYSILLLISHIANNHLHSSYFYNKIEKILSLISDDMIKHYSNSDIYTVFRKNKRVLLYLIESNILKITKSIVDSIFNPKNRYNNYHQFFTPEIITIIDEDMKLMIEKEVSQDFKKMRKIGENDSKLCEIIRNDDIEEFIIYHNKTDLNLNSIIPVSIYETNQLLLKADFTIIEYTAFFGSIQIFRYLHLNGVELTRTLWVCSMHGENQEIIDILVNNSIEIPYKLCMKEAIKSHHNNMARYIQDNFKENEKVDEKIDEFNDNIYSYAFHYYNFEFFPDDINNYKYAFYYICKYDHLNLLENLFKSKKIDINKPVKDNDTGIHLASTNNKSKIVNFLLKQPDLEFGNECFKKWYQLIKINIPLFITKLGNNCFEKCISLEQIEIPESVMIIGESSFKDCISLSNITFFSPLKELKDSVFSGCTSLKEIKIPDSVTTIGDRAFEKCSSLTRIIIPDSVTSIGNYAFSECSSLKEISIPNSILSIGDHFFYRCISLTNVSFSPSLVSIENNAFYGCESLKQLMIPESVTSIGIYAFSDCSSLDEISVPNSIKVIDEGYFDGCLSLAKISFSSSLTTIGIFAFRYCFSLKQIIIPSSVTSIEKRAFLKCTSLESITIPSSVTSIGIYAFAFCVTLNQIVFQNPCSLTKIDIGTFFKCKQLTEISIPQSIISIESSAFDSCSSLKQIDIPSSIVYIKKSAFDGCESLLKESIPSQKFKDDPKYDPCLLI